MGFSIQVPKHWLPPEKKGTGTLVFSGPKGSEQYQTTINVQLVRSPAGSSLAKEVQEIEKQWGAAPQYRLLAKQTGTLAGQRGVRLLAQYQLPGTTQMFKQEQFIVDRSPYFFWLGYTAPLALFDKHQAVMVQAVNTLKFVPFPAAAAPRPPAAAPAPAPSSPPPASQATLPPPTPAQPAAAQPRIYDLKPCRSVDNGAPQGVTQVFPPDAGTIYVWFRFRGLDAGALLRSEWFLGQGGSMQKVADASTKVDNPAIAWGEFHLNIRQGQKFPVGDYRVDIYVGQVKEASISFRVQ
ncbi:MAG: DcrB-related protein [Thermodesulfobacteriota bacterium]